MKFLIDAQLPVRLSRFLQTAGLVELLSQHSLIEMSRDAIIVHQ